MSVALETPSPSVTTRPQSLPRTSPDPQPTQPESSATARFDVTFALVSVCLVLSGFAALLYETAWLRQFAIVFGTSELALAVVLATYMGGLAIGSVIASRVIDRVTRPVLVYGFLELGIGLSALAVPFAIKFTRFIHVAWLGGLAELPDAGGATQSAFYLASAFAILVIPTGLMGATLPLLIRHVVRRDDQVGTRVGLLYALNTAGAVAGTLATAFALLPRFGLMGTVWIGVAVNVAVFLLAAFLSRRPSFAYASASTAGKHDSAPTRLTAAPTSTQTSSILSDMRLVRIEATLNERSSWILAIIFLSGLVSFTYEVLWTRLLSHILGGSLYAFATMLAGFLAGLTIGSAIASQWARERGRAVAGFAFAQAGIAVLSLGAYHLLGKLPVLAFVVDAGEHAGLWANAVIACLVLVPGTICIGATFPFAVRILARDENAAGSATARVYAWNTVGAILGSLAAAMFLLPRLGFEGTATVAMATNLILCLATVLFFWRVTWIPVLGAVVGAGLLIAAVPEWPESILRMSPFTSQPQDGRVVFSKAGRSTTVLMLERDGYYSLRNNGLPEAGIAPRGAPPGGWEGHRWLSVLPVLARPHAESMLIVGFGGGTAAAGVPRTVDSVDVIELEPEVIEANRLIADNRVKDPLSDPRVRVILNDARNALALSVKRYDAIVSQPSHPWTAGASHLYTREFLQLVKNHLNTDGVFLQWMSMNLVDEELFKTVGATLLDVFPYVRLYCPHDDAAMFLASESPLSVEEWLTGRDSPGTPTRFESLVSRSPEEFRWLGVNSVHDVAAALTLEEEAVARLCRGAAVNTDNDNRLATRSPRTLGDRIEFDVERLLGPFDPITDPDSQLSRVDGFQPNRVYIARRLANQKMSERAMRVAESIEDSAQRLLARGLVFAKEGQQDDARRLFRESLTLAPDDENAGFAFVEPFLVELARGKARPEIALIANGLRGPAAATVYACRLHTLNDLRSFANLDEQLAHATPTDAFYPLATNFRAFWRAKVAAPELRQVYGDQALKIIDVSLAADPSVFGALVRVQASASAERPDALVESIRYVADLFGTQSYSVSPRMIRSTAPMLLRRLDTVTADHPEMEDRVECVRKKLLSVVESVSS